ncbi:MAG TPA: CRISPR-associated endonuclease Cas1 [Methylomirabilota bacterium]|nr:CRISPR-associated endonuclease Cas1 [Methylomirabilota bacterium]
MVIDTQQMTLPMISDEHKERIAEIDRETERLTALEETRQIESRMEKLTNLKMRNSDTIVLSGHGCYIKVRNDGLAVEYSVSGSQENVRVLTMHRGVHRIKQIIVVAKSGYISLDAIEWTANQGITVIMLNFKGELITVLTPQQSRNAKLSYLQIQASESPLSLTISKELIRQKTLAQIETLKSIDEYKHTRVFKKYRAARVWSGPPWILLENEVSTLQQLDSVEAVRVFEANLAMYYWSELNGIPIKFDRVARKSIPPHWLSISQRISDVSYFHNAHQASNPYHSALNFAYALLEAQCLEAITLSGLDPSIPFLHSYQENKHALVWDVMECWRASIDYLVIELFQRTTFSKGDFYQELTGEVRLSEELRRYIIASCRVDNISIDRQVRWLRSTLLEQ